MKPSMDLIWNYRDFNNIIYESIHDTVLLFYDEIQNVFVDSDGYIVFNLFDYVSPNDLYLFRSKKEDLLVQNSEGYTVELIWPEHDETYMYGGL